MFANVKKDFRGAFLCDTMWTWLAGYPPYWTWYNHWLLGKRAFWLISRGSYGAGCHSWLLWLLAGCLLIFMLFCKYLLITSWLIVQLDKVRHELEMDGVYILSQSYDLVLIPSYKRWYFYLEDNISGVAFLKRQQNLLYEERLYCLTNARQVHHFH